uniref:SCP domain-containing protein n=1 Tax=Taenia asiatica TaxID=60517 RepID=A0A0R3WAZ5_TAEAS
LLLHALPQELFLAAINAEVTADSDIDRCCEILSQLAIDHRERSLARGFFHWDQKVGENDEEYARDLQLLAERAFRGCPPARVTDWVAVQFCAGVRPPTIAAMLNAIKTNDLNQLVEAATRKRQKLLLTSAPRAVHRRPNPPRYPCRFLLDSGTVGSLVNPKAFPDLFRKFRARPFSIKLSTEGRKMKAVGETPLKVTVGKESWTVQFIIRPELVWDVILGADFLRKTGAILNFAEGTFTAQQHKTTKSVEPSPGKDADEICSALFEAAGIPVNKLDELCSRLRALHGCAPLTYDAKLAKQAQKHAEYLIKQNKMEHSKNRDYGENIALKGGTPGFSFTGYDASYMWYSEIKDYDFKGGDQIKCGHFTQLVWSDTKRAGFGVAKSSKGDKVIIVGQYKPPGNYMGEFKAKVPRPTNGKVRVPDASELSAKVRALHGCRPLTYDPELSKQAQKHAEFLALKRRMVHSYAFDYGENIAKKFGTPGFILTGPEATRMWYSEIEDYDFDGGDQVTCGHFTQCVWSDTERAGFGYAKAREGDLVIVVGQYRPPGNYSGEFPVKVPRPLSGEPRVPSLEELSTK